MRRPSAENPEPLDAAVTFGGAAVLAALMIADMSTTRPFPSPEIVGMTNFQQDMLIVLGGMGAYWGGRFGAPLVHRAIDETVGAIQYAHSYLDLEARFLINRAQEKRRELVDGAHQWRDEKSIAIQRMARQAILSHTARYNLYESDKMLQALLAGNRTIDAGIADFNQAAEHTFELISVLNDQQRSLIIKPPVFESEIKRTLAGEKVRYSEDTHDFWEKVGVVMNRYDTVFGIHELASIPLTEWPFITEIDPIDARAFFIALGNVITERNAVALRRLGFAFLKFEAAAKQLMAGAPQDKTTRRLDQDEIALPVQKIVGAGPLVASLVGTPGQIRRFEDRRRAPSQPQILDALARARAASGEARQMLATLESQAQSDTSDTRIRAAD